MLECVQTHSLHGMECMLQHAFHSTEWSVSHSKNALRVEWNGMPESEYNSTLGTRLISVRRFINLMAIGEVLAKFQWHSTGNYIYREAQ